MVTTERPAFFKGGTVESPKGEPSPSSLLFENPEKFLTDDEKEWLSEATIAHIAPPLMPVHQMNRRYGGIEDVVLNNIRALEYYGAKKQILFGHPGNKFLSEEIKGLVAFAPVPINPDENWIHVLRENPERAATMERQYLLGAYDQIAQDDSITVVHDHTKGGRYFGQALSRVIPIIRTEHGPLTTPYISEDEDAALRLYEYEEDMGYVAISHDQMSQRRNLNWLDVNHNGVNPDNFRFSKEVGGPLVSIGRVHPDKGVHNAVQLARIANRQLIIAGEVEITKDYDGYYEREIAPYVDGDLIEHKKEGVNAEERKELYAQSGCLLMLNEWPEPFGMVMAETMMSGKPIVGFRKGSIPELVVNGKTGFVVDTIDEAVKAVEEVMRGNYSPEECRRRAEKFFSSYAMGARYVKLAREQQRRFNAKRLNHGPYFSYSLHA